MKFAHLADCHLGSWRQPELQALNLQAFRTAIIKCIEEKVDFVVIAGDLFDTAMPSLDVLKEAISEFKKLNDNGIKCYIIPGSHDFSVSGKTFLDVIERAGFCRNISSMGENEDFYNIDIAEENINNKKVLFAGIPGKKASVELEYFKKLKLNSELLSQNKNNLKIFVLHTTITESKPEDLDFVESVDIKDLPDGFDYYAAGHLHLNDEHKKNNALVVYPGPIFPANIEELEKLKKGSFYMVEAENSRITKTKKEDIVLKNILVLNIDVDNFPSHEANLKILEELSKQDFKDKILILKIKGCLSSGKTSDINFDKIREKTKEAYSLLKSTSGLTTQELKIEMNTEATDIEGLENEFINKYKNKAQDEFKKFNDVILSLISALNLEKQEGERNDVFEDRVFKNAEKILFDKK